jgi:hypothetical protein
MQLQPEMDYRYKVSIYKKRQTKISSVKRPPTEDHPEHHCLPEITFKRKIWIERDAEM